MIALESRRTMEDAWNELESPQEPTKKQEDALSARESPKKKREDVWPAKVEWYQATLYLSRRGLTIGTSLLLFMQLLVLHQLQYSVTNRGCASSDECIRGASCSWRARHTGKRNICAECGTLVDGNETTRVERLCHRVYDEPSVLERYNDNDPSVGTPRVEYKKNSVYKRHTQSYAPSVFVEVCAGCIDVDGTYKSLARVSDENVRSMRLGDAVTLCICSLAVALAVVAELRQARVMELALTCRARHPALKAYLAVLNAVRIYILLPKLVAITARLVLFIGSDTASILFNTVTAIFIVELDDILLATAFTPKVQDVLEKQATLYLLDAHHQHVNLIQMWALVAVFVAVFFGVFLSTRGDSDDNVYYSYYMALLALVTEVVFYEDRPFVSKFLYTLVTHNDPARCDDDCNDDLLLPPTRRRCQREPCALVCDVGLVIFELWVSVSCFELLVPVLLADASSPNL